MISLSKIINDPAGLVSKLVFEDDTAIAETVAYRHRDRGVVCFSVQSGCPVGCAFCGTGNRFIRNLSREEMHLQIREGLKFVGNRKKLQIMSMSMGDPMLNWENVHSVAADWLSDRETYFFVSTVGLDFPNVLEEIVEMGMWRNRFGLQFSLHETDDSRRRSLFRNKDLPFLPIDGLVKWGRLFTERTGNKAYFNYIVKRHDDAAADVIARKFHGLHVTFSVLCDTKKMSKGNADDAVSMAAVVFQKSEGLVECSTFDPAGQDTIGGGCGQLLFVQERMKRMAEGNPG